MNQTNEAMKIWPEMQHTEGEIVTKQLLIGGKSPSLKSLDHSMP